MLLLSEEEEEEGQIIAFVCCCAFLLSRVKIFRSSPPKKNAFHFFACSMISYLVSCFIQEPFFFFGTYFFHIQLERFGWRKSPSPRGSCTSKTRRCSRKLEPAICKKCSKGGTGPGLREERCASSFCCCCCWSPSPIKSSGRTIRKDA